MKTSKTKGRPKKRKQRPKAILHRVETLDIDIRQRGKKRRILHVQRHKGTVNIKDFDLTKNPEKLSFCVLTNKYGDRLEMFAYKNNPKKGFISINGQVIGADAINWRRIQKGLMKMGKFLGLLK